MQKKQSSIRLMIMLLFVVGASFVCGCKNREDERSYSDMAINAACGNQLIKNGSEVGFKTPNGHVWFSSNLSAAVSPTLLKSCLAQDVYYELNSGDIDTQKSDQIYVMLFLNQAGQASRTQIKKPNKSCQLTDIAGLDYCPDGGMRDYYLNLDSNVGSISCNYAWPSNPNTPLKNIKNNFKLRNALIENTPCRFYMAKNDELLSFDFTYKNLAKLPHIYAIVKNSYRISN